MAEGGAIKNRIDIFIWEAAAVEYLLSQRVILDVVSYSEGPSKTSFRRDLQEETIIKVFKKMYFFFEMRKFYLRFKYIIFMTLP